MREVIQRGKKKEVYKIRVQGEKEMKMMKEQLMEIE